MKNRPYRSRMGFRERLQGFLYGRNGADSLGNAVLIFAISLSAVNLFLRSVAVTLIVYVAVFYSFFRMMSRNVAKRRSENDRWRCFWRRVKNFFVLRKNKWRDRKTHVYHQCPHCKNTLRLPRVKGAHTVCCPCCRKRFEMKVK